MPDTRALSIVIPVFNAEASLPELWDRLCTVMDGLKLEFEANFVDDGSRDGSWNALQTLAGSDPRCKAMRLMRNQGQHNALICGIRAARYPTSLTMDDDLQHPPEEIPKLLAAFSEGFDVVYGTFSEQQHGFFRILASRLTKLALQKTMGIGIATSVSAFRVFRTDLRRAFENYNGPLPNLDVMLSWGTTRFGSVSVGHQPRKAGGSGYTLGKLIVHALNMVTGYTVLPLQFASLLGFVFTFFGLGLLSFTIFRYIIQGTPVQGFPFLASIICIFSGAQLFCLGIIGEYFARLYLKLMDKPMFTVADRLNID